MNGKWDVHHLPCLLDFLPILRPRLIPLLFFFSQKKGKRGRDRGGRESKAGQRMAKELWGVFSYKIRGAWLCFLWSNCNHLTVMVNHVLFCFGMTLSRFCFRKSHKGITRWTRGQLEVLPGTGKEEQGEEEQVVSQAPESKDGAAGLMFCSGTFARRHPYKPSPGHPPPIVCWQLYCHHTVNLSSWQTWFCTFFFLSICDL